MPKPFFLLPAPKPSTHTKVLLQSNAIFAKSNLHSRIGMLVPFENIDICSVYFACLQTSFLLRKPRGLQLHLNSNILLLSLLLHLDGFRLGQMSLSFSIFITYRGAPIHTHTSSSDSPHPPFSLSTFIAYQALQSTDTNTNSMNRCNGIWMGSRGIGIFCNTHNKVTYRTHSPLLWILFYLHTFSNCLITFQMADLNFVPYCLMTPSQSHGFYFKFEFFLLFVRRLIRRTRTQIGWWKTVKLSQIPGWRDTKSVHLKCILSKTITSIRRHSRNLLYRQPTTLPLQVHTPHQWNQLNS